MSVYAWHVLSAIMDFCIGWRCLFCDFREYFTLELVCLHSMGPHCVLLYEIRNVSFMP